GTGGATGGTGGVNTGGTGGATGGTGGTGGAGVRNINPVGCPQTAPSTGTVCTKAVTCCYTSHPLPFVCAIGGVSLDGGIPLGTWKSVNSKVCCPESAPTPGHQCNVPGAIGCCYGPATSGFFCNTAKDPDAWDTRSCVSIDPN
ncbi:MAG TPA: hypothetical protein PKA88_21435, partial [Polyangiaceae bacterium]|nr:hypothetical protein [Polyangiaceae bacterium]